jgi:hypothetical protein
MQSIYGKGLRTLLAAAVTAAIATPLALAGADGPGATGSAKADTAKQVKALKKLTAKLAKQSAAFAERVAVLEERTALLEGGGSAEPRSQGGPAGGDLTGTYPNPQLGPNVVGSAEISDNAVEGADIADGDVGTAEIGDFGIGAVDLAAGIVRARGLGEVQFVRNATPLTVQPGANVQQSISCPPGGRLLAGGHEWAVPTANGASVISSSPGEFTPRTTWSVQARVDSGGQQNRIFAIALCLID